jgi:deazaflavin-dependent oxidoreductase (nitroreductase family)
MLSRPWIMKHELHLDPQTRRVVRSVAQIVNPAVALLAGRRWMPILGVMHHAGRRSGRIYHTPLGMRRSGDTVVMPRTFGEDAGWYRNIIAAGSAEANYLGRCYRLVDPEVIDYETAAPAFPRYERLQFRLIGINQFLRLRIASSCAESAGTTSIKEA